MALFTELGDRVALGSQFSRRAVVRGLRLSDRLLDALDFVGGSSRLGGGGFGGCLGLDPTGVKQSSFDPSDLVGQLAVTLRRPSLPPELGRALLLLREDLA